MRCKSQSSIEFLSVYGFAFLIIALVIAVVYGISGLPKTIVPSQCSLYGSLTCEDAIYAPTGTSHSTFFAEIYDGQTGTLNVSTFNATLNSRSSVNGVCVPHTVRAGQTMYCIANFSAASVLGLSYVGTMAITGTYCPQSPGSLTNGQCNWKGQNTYIVSGTLKIQGSNVPSSASLDTAYYIPINVINTQTGAEPVPFQQMISFNPSSYSAYESQNLGNIRFYLNGTELYSWCESGCTSTSSNAIFWVSVPVVMPAGSTTPLTMYFLPTIVQYDGIYAGEAPQFSNTYGQYDNGANVFLVYANGDTPTSDFTVTSGYTLSQAQNLEYNFEGTEIINALKLSGYKTGSSINFYLNTIALPASQPYIAEANGQWYTTATTGDTDIAALIQSPLSSPNAIAVGGIPGYNNVFFQQEYISSGVYTYDINPKNVAGQTWVYGSLTYLPGNSIYSAYSSTSLYTYTSSGSTLNPISPTGGNIYLGVIGHHSSSTYPANAYWNWLRVRAYPYNGVMPTADFGSVSPTNSIVP